jgi:hypothetical protein
MRDRCLTGVVVLTFVAGACGGGDNSSSEAGEADSSGGESGAVSATVRVGEETYEFDTATACTTDGFIAIEFQDDEDWVSLNVAGGVILVRVMLGGRSGSTSARPIRRRCRANRCRGRARCRLGANGSR